MRGEREDPGPHRVPIGDSIDLHTFVPREIASVVEDYLEEAVRAGIRQVRIIHGRGTGTQRQIVRSVFSRSPLVESYAEAPPEAGGWGATVAVLRPRGPSISGR